MNTSEQHGLVSIFLRVARPIQLADPLRAREVQELAREMAGLETLVKRIDRLQRDLSRLLGVDADAHEIRTIDCIRAWMAELDRECGRLRRRRDWWIPVTERVPSDTCEVLAWITGPAGVVQGEPFLDIVLYNAAREKWQCGGFAEDDVEVIVSHWMEVPPAPGMQRDGDISEPSGDNVPGDHPMSSSE